MEFLFQFVKILQLSLAILFIIFPGIGLMHVLWPLRPHDEKLILGSALGLSLAIYLSMSIGYIDLLLFFPGWGVLSLIVGWLAFKMRKRFFLPGADSPIAVFWFPVILAAIFFYHIGMAIGQEVPPGWDPTYHLIFAQKIFNAQKMIFDWLPYENISLNYPVGGHFLLVVISMLSGLPLHVVFNLSFAFIVVLSCALIYLITKRIFGSEETAIYAAMAYGLMLRITLYSYKYGFYPNGLAMISFLSIIFFLMSERLEFRKHIALFAIFWVSIFFTHHHVMFTALICFVTLFFFYYRTDILSSQKRHLIIFYGMVLGGGLGLSYIVYYFFKTFEIRTTNVLTTDESLYTLQAMIQFVGIPFFILSIAGILLYVIQRDRPKEGTFVMIFLVLIGLFVFFEYFSRLLNIYLLGVDRVAFSPGRFFYDLTYFLSILVGYALYYFRKVSRCSVRVAVVLIVSLVFTNYGFIRGIYFTNFPSDSWQAYQWIKSNMPPETYILNVDSTGRRYDLADAWAPYATGRRCYSVHIPPSEPTVNVRGRVLWLSELRRGNPKALTPYPLVLLGSVEDARMHSRKVLWSHISGLAVIEYWPGERKNGG